MVKLLIFLAVISVLVYYLTVMLYVCFPKRITLTNRKMKFSRIIVPFYYWFAPKNEKTPKAPREPKAEIKDEVASEPPAKKRGRPVGSKNKPKDIIEAPAPKKRGRPKKNANEVSKKDQKAVFNETVPQEKKRGRGRPRKVVSTKD